MSTRKSSAGHLALRVALALALLSAIPMVSHADEGGLSVLGVQFSGGRAMKLLKRQVEMGPRVPGTIPHEHAWRLIEKELTKYLDIVEKQRFTYLQDGWETRMTNVIGYLHPEASRLALVAAHYDTRPFADMDESWNQDKPIPGANDGASGVAVLLELARVLAGKLPDNVGVVFVFFDGEDFGRTTEGMFLGSRYYARHLEPNVKARIVFGVLLDMVGDRDLSILRESRSESVAHGVFQALLELQDALGLDVLSPSTTITVMDDHIPLIEEGLAVYNLIDFDYEPWHTLEDTPDKTSVRSLQAVGLLVENLLLNFGAGNLSL